MVACLATLACAPAVRAQSGSAAKRVLVLYWDNKDFPGNVRFDESFKKSLKSYDDGAIEYYPEYIETTRFPGQNQAFFFEYLRQKYAARNIDVVVATSDVPLNFLLQYRADLFPTAPIVFVSNDPPGVVKLATPPGMTGIVHQSTYRETLNLALKLQPDIKQVFVISGSLEHDKRFETTAREELREFANKFELIYLTDMSLSELSTKVASLPKNSIALYVWQQALDERGKILETYEVLARIAPAASVPIYGMGSGNIGQGIIGGYLQGPDLNGGKAAAIALRILNGKNAQDIRVEGAPSVPMFDWRQLNRWGISEISLPPGSVVKFKEFTFWDQYKWYIMGLVAAVIFEAMLIAWLLLLRSRRRQAEDENMRLAELAQTQHRRLDEIVSNVPGVVWETIIDPETKERKVTFISDHVSKMLGYTPEEWLAAPSGQGLRLMPEGERERVMRESEAVIETGQVGISQFHWQAKDGRTLWVENHLSPIFNGSNRVAGLRGVALDVTDRKLAEESLRKTEEKDLAILNAIPDLMFLQTPDGVYIDYHAQDVGELFVPPDKFLGRNMREVLPPDLAETFSRYLKRAAETGEAQSLEYKLPYHPTDRWFETRIVRCGENVLSVVREITERIQRTTELRQSEERFEKAFRANPQPMSLTSLSEGRYIDVNESFLAMSGYSREEVIGRTSLELCIWETPQHRREFISQLLRHGSIVNLETRFRTKNGSLRMLLSSAETLEIAGEECLMVASSDITDRVSAQHALRESEARFRNVADTAPVMIWVSDINKMCTYFNKQGLD
ncbi:MAG TPA: ABC transporter substrate binding protein, partial [Pyrinomonadaceae bacterium]|nr:ABC transporter substrate binding protein [Pyrinomonadaceae bacterium]